MALVQEGVLVVEPGTDLVDDLVGAHGLCLGEDLVEHGQEVVLEDLSVTGVGDQDVSEPADLVLVPEHGVVHHEVALVVVCECPGQVVVEGSAGGDDDIDHVVPDHVHDDSAGSGGHDACGEGQDLEATLLLDHGCGDVCCIGQFLGGESSRTSHGLEHLVDGHSLFDLDVFNCDQFEFLFAGHDVQLLLKPARKEVV